MKSDVTIRRRALLEWVAGRAPASAAARLIALAALLLIAPASRAQAALAAECVFCDGVRLQDEIMVINTRGLCGTCDPASMRSGMFVETYAMVEDAGCRRWQRSDVEEFVAYDPTVPTIMFVHGNQVTALEAKVQGLAMYRRLIECGCHAGPIRFVIYSWPSERVGFILRDVRVKAMRTGPAACQLAWLLDQMQPQTPVSLVGFSFGARIITGGLHILAGGSLGCGMELHERANLQRAPMNVVLLAAALHAHWLGEGQYHGLAMTQVNRMFLVNNCQDLAMRYYHLSTPGHDRVQALGLRGPTCIGPEYASKIQMRDVSHYAGSQHELFRYLCAPGVMCQIWAYTAGSQMADVQVATR